jgi:hypothetical protein
LTETAQYHHIPTSGLNPDDSDLQIVSIFGNCTKAANGEGSQDCTQVCGQKNCAKCIDMYWGASPTTCVPGCRNADIKKIGVLEIQVKAQAEKIAELEKENEALRSGPGALKNEQVA